MKKLIIIILFVTVFLSVGCSNYHLSYSNPIKYNGNIYFFHKSNNLNFSRTFYGDMTYIGKYIVPFWGYGEMYILDSIENEEVIIVDTRPRWNEYYIFVKVGCNFLDENSKIESVKLYYYNEEYSDLEISDASFSSLFICEFFAKNPLKVSEFKEKLTSAHYWMHLTYDIGYEFSFDLFYDNNGAVYINVFDDNTNNSYFYKLSDEYNDLIYNKLTEHSLK